MNIIYNPETRRFSDDLPSQVRLVKRFSNEDIKAKAKGKIARLKERLAEVKDPEVRNKLLKKLGKWTAIAAGVGLAGYAGRELVQGYRETSNSIDGINKALEAEANNAESVTNKGLAAKEDATILAKDKAHEAAIKFNKGVDAANKKISNSSVGGLLGKVGVDTSKLGKHIPVPDKATDKDREIALGYHKKAKVADDLYEENSNKAMDHFKTVHDIQNDKLQTAFLRRAGGKLAHAVKI